LILVGSLMAGALREIQWDHPEIAIPAFLTITTIPLTFSIATGLAFGFVSYTAIKIFRGKFSEVNWFVYALTAIFLFRFLYLAKE
jgi:AGZA family xanthine/uracil permease-like MFS transporter